jgi:multimeric flavodoxin WrbA
MKIIGFNGSPRKHGNTSTIMAEMLRGAASEGAETKFIHLPSHHIENCIGCERCRNDKTCTSFFDGMHLLYPLIEESEGIILGSPTYNYDMTPWMKAFIDRFYPFFDFGEVRPGPYTSRLANRGKKALVFGVCEQVNPEEMNHNITCMRDAIKVIGYEVFDMLAFPGHFQANSVKSNVADLHRAFESGALFARSII